VLENFHKMISYVSEPERAVYSHIILDCIFPSFLALVSLHPSSWIGRLQCKINSLPQNLNFGRASHLFRSGART